MPRLFNDDCLNIMKSDEFRDYTKNKKVIIVTDPPFNIGYHYNSYKDRMDEEIYYEWLKDIFSYYPLVCVHYPEALYKLSFKLGKFPNRVVSWVYNSNTAKQHRDIAFFDVKPNFNQVRQPYKNLNDKRIKKRIAEGKTGAKIYDWWNVNQVKNVSKDKTKHPCQMPQEVMNNIIGILPKDDNLIIVDPFMGSGTTGLACEKYGVDFIGIESDKEYFDIAAKRLDEYKNRS